MKQGESFQVNNGAAATFGPWAVQGGLYHLAAQATWGGGSLTLKQLLPDGSTFFSTYLLTPASVTPVATLTADGVGLVYLPPGQVELVFATGSALYARLTRVPLD